jgi:hypothetical protein
MPPRARPLHGVISAFEDVARSGTEVTNYDREHTVLYRCLLDRDERGRDWRETVRAFFGIDFDSEPERARRVYDSHLATATSLKNVLDLALMCRMAPYLWMIRQRGSWRDPPSREQNFG